jgi:uncharacterized protein (DUF362 family)
MLRRAFDLAGAPRGGGWNLVKPNLVSHPAPPGVTTDPGLVHALCEHLTGRITIAEGPGGWREGGWGAYAGYETLDLNYAETLAWQKYTLARAVRECDTYITLSPLKTNKGTGVSLALKNAFGTAPGSVYGWPKFGLHALGPLEETIVDLYQYRPPDYAILGGCWGVEGEGDQPVHHNVLVAGENAVAVDMVAARVMGFEPEEIGFLRVACRRGLCPAVEILGDFEIARRPFRRSAQWEAACR